LEQIISVKNIKMKYQSPEGETMAIDDVSFDVNDGDFVSIIGPSGCGKSTLLSIIANLLPYDSGEILLNGKPVSSNNESIGYMLQKDCLFEWRTIRKNVLLGLEIKGLKTKENIEYADELLNTYGLYEFKDKYPRQLSGGMRQRCALIRTLVTRPRLLLLDEAFSALDYQTRLSVVDDIYEIIKKEKKTVLMVTHDISESISVSNRIIVLTKRPASIKSVHSISFSQQGLSPFNRREQPEFREYFNKIWSDIDVHM